MNMKVEQIRRSHASARPKPAVNPAWANTHQDVGVLLSHIDEQQIALNSCIAALSFLRQREGECLGDHPDWVRRIDAVLAAHFFGVA